MVAYFCKQAVDKDNANQDGATAVYLASKNGHLDVVSYLSKQSVDKDNALQHGTTGLYLASQNGPLG